MFGGEQVLHCRSWRAEHERVAEPVGGANGDEPFSSVAIPTSAAAPPRRSPRSLADYALALSFDLRLQLTPRGKVAHQLFGNPDSAD